MNGFANPTCFMLLLPISELFRKRSSSAPPVPPSWLSTTKPLALSFWAWVGEEPFDPGRALIARLLAEIIGIQVNHAVFPVFAAQQDQGLIFHDFDFSHFRMVEDLDPVPGNPINRPV